VTDAPLLVFYEHCSSLTLLEASAEFWSESVVLIAGALVDRDMGRKGCQDRRFTHKIYENRKYIEAMRDLTQAVGNLTINRALSRKGRRFSDWELGAGGQ
jgi:hypothetical protein